MPVGALVIITHVQRFSQRSLCEGLGYREAEGPGEVLRSRWLHSGSFEGPAPIWPEAAEGRPQDHGGHASGQIACWHGPPASCLCFLPGLSSRGPHSESTSARAFSSENFWFGLRISCPPVTFQLEKQIVCVALQHRNSQLDIPSSGQLLEPAELLGLQQVTFDTIYAPYIVVAFSTKPCQGGLHCRF